MERSLRIRLHLQNNGVKEKRRVPDVPTDQTQRSAHATCQRVSNKKLCRRPRVRQPVIKNPASSVTYNTGSR